MQHGHLPAAIIKRSSPSYTLCEHGLVELGAFRINNLRRESVLSAAMTFCGEYIAPGDGKRIELSGRGDALPNLDDRLEFDLEAFSPSGNEEDDERLANQLNMAHDLVVAVSDLIVGPCQLIRDQLKQFR